MFWSKPFYLKGVVLFPPHRTKIRFPSHQGLPQLWMWIVLEEIIDNTTIQNHPFTSRTSSTMNVKTSLITPQCIIYILMDFINVVHQHCSYDLDGFHVQYNKNKRSVIPSKLVVKTISNLMEITWMIQSWISRFVCLDPNRFSSILRWSWHLFCWLCL